MRITQPVLGKIIQHGDGMGVPTSETVRTRAQELALIEGRKEYTDQDWKRAFHELHGGHHDPMDHNGSGRDDEMLTVISERDMVAPTLGHHVGRMAVDGGDSLGEELVAEGMEEAEHDQMLQARRSVDLPDEDSEDEEA